MTKLLGRELTQLLPLLDNPVKNKAVFLKRISQGQLSREENALTHVCIYFAAFDPIAKQVFIGHHKKSGLWLFNGGHVDIYETLPASLLREAREEWGLKMDPHTLPDPSLLTITKILPNPNMLCEYHYEVWYFFEVNRHTFSPIPKNIDTEFYEMKWLTPGEAKKLVQDPNTRKVLGIMEKKFGI